MLSSSGSYDALHDDVHDEVLQENVLHDHELHDNEIRGNVIHDSVLHEDVEVDLSNGAELQVEHTKQYLSPITRKQILYLTLFQGVGSGVVNFVINFLIAYAMYHNVPGNLIPFSSTLTCVVSDVVMTSFLIPCLTGIIGFFLLKNDLRVGKMITPIDRHYLKLPVLKYIPAGHAFVEVVKRSVLFGLSGVVIFVPPTLLIIYLATGTRGIEALWTYVAFKGWWSGLVALVVSPVLAFVAIAYATHDDI